MGGLETTVTEPGTLSFWWKVSSEPGFDYLRVAVDGGEAGKISGATGWGQRSLVIPAGDHSIRRRYTKDLSLSRGTDAGWLDQVSFTATPPATLVYVDWRNTAPNPDGTVARPFPTVPQGITAGAWRHGENPRWHLRSPGAALEQADESRKPRWPRLDQRKRSVGLRYGGDTGWPAWPVRAPSGWFDDVPFHHIPGNPVSKWPTYQRLPKLPGIGKILGLTIALETGDAQCFADAGHLLNLSALGSGKASGERVAKCEALATVTGAASQIRQRDGGYGKLN